MALRATVSVVHDGQILDPGAELAGLSEEAEAALLAKGQACDESCDTCTCGHKPPTATPEEVEEKVAEVADAKADAEDAQAELREAATELGDLTVEQLRDYAREHDLNLHGASTKKAIIAAIKAES